MDDQIASPTYPTTREIVIDRANGRIDCQLCVNWAIGLMLEGTDEPCVCHLAGECHPFDPNAIAVLRDRALAFLGSEQLSDDEMLCHMLAYRLSDAGDDISTLRSILIDAREMYVARELDDLYQLYLLSHAWDELEELGQQWYVDGMNERNSNDFTTRSVATFIAAHQNWG